MAINKNKVQLQETVLDSNGHPLSSTDVNPLTSSDCVIMENGMTLEDVMGNDTVIDTPTIMNEDTSFKVGIGDSETKVIDSDVAKMVIEGKTYQNILPKPTTLIMNTDEKEFKINDKIDSSIVLDDNVAEIATVKGQTYVNVVQEESASEYVAIDEELNGQSITTSGKPEGIIKNATLEGMTLVNTIQEPSEANSVVLDLDADINAQGVTINNTAQGGIHGAKLNGMTLLSLTNLDNFSKNDQNSMDANGYITVTSNGGYCNAFFKPHSTVKENTAYLLILDVIENTIDKQFSVNGGYTTAEGKHWTIVKEGYYIEPLKTGRFTFKVSTRTKAECTDGYYMLRSFINEKATVGTKIKYRIQMIEYKEGMENWDIPYFEGMQSVEVPSVMTTGKNLFDGELITGKIEDNGKPNTYVSTMCMSANYTRVKPNTTYNYKWNQERNNSRVFFYDVNKNFIKKDENFIPPTGGQFTTPSNCYYILFHLAVNTGMDSYTVLITKSNDLTYEPYKSSTLTTPSDVVLRKVGDVQDELDLETGKLTQRIGEVVLNGSESWWHNTDYVTDTLIEFGYNIGASIKGDNTIICDKFQPTDVNGVERIYMLQNGNVYIRILKTKVTTVDEFKTWLASNPITVQYVLKKLITRQIDLSIVDQSNNPIPTIQTHPTLTHVSTSSQGLIPNVVIPSQLKYPTIIKPSTTYTVQLKQTTTNSEFPLTINLGGTTMAVPSAKFTITTPSELTSQDTIFTGKNNVIGEVVITEGDTTGIEYDFFEGMNDVKSPSVYATGKNLFDGELEDGYIGTDGTNIGWANYKRSINFIKINSKLKYRISKNPLHLGGTFGIFQYDSNKQFISIYYISSTANEQTFIFDGRTNYIKIACRHDESHPIEYIQIEEGSTTTSYEPYKGVTIEQSIDSIPLTSDMFEQGGLVSDPLVAGMSLQQVVKGESTNTTRIRSKSLIQVKPNCKYILNGGLTGWGLAYDKNGGYVATINNIETFITTSNTYYITPVLRISDNSNITPLTLDSLNLTLQEVPQEIVLRSLPNGVKDTLNLTTGEYVQRIGELVLDGSEDEQLTLYNRDNFTNVIGVAILKRNNCDRLSSTSIISDKFVSRPGADVANIDEEGIYARQDLSAIYVKINKTKLNTQDVNGFKQYFQQNPLTIQYQLETPIIHKVNLTNTTKLPSYASTTHYDTIVPSNSLVPNIKIPSTIDYNVAIKPSTQYTVRCNTTNALSIDLGGATGALSNGKVTLTTPSTLAHNSLKLGSSGKAKEVMVIEGNEIKDNVPFFNGMKNVQMGGIKLVNIARGATISGTTCISVNTNNTAFTYNGQNNNFQTVNFDNTLLKPNTKYTIYLNITENTSTLEKPIKFLYSGDNYFVDLGGIGVKKVVVTTPNEIRRVEIAFRPTTTSQQVVISNPMIIEGDWTHLDEIPFIESEMIIEQPIIRSQGKNLFDKNTVKYIQGFISSSEKIIETSNVKTYYIECKPNITYTISKVKSNYFRFASTSEKPNLNCSLSNIVATDTESFLSINTTSNDKYLCFNIYDNSVSSNITEEEILKTLQLEEGSSATSYEPFKQHTLYSNRVIGYEEGCYYAYGGGTKTQADTINSVMADVEGLSVAYVTGGSSNYTFWDKDDVFISGKVFLDTVLSSFDKNGFIQVPSNAKYMRFAAGNDKNAQNLYRIATVTGELPLRSLPNGVCDSFNLVTGEYVQRVGELTIDGSNVSNLINFYDHSKVSGASGYSVNYVLNAMSSFNTYTEASPIVKCNKLANISQQEMDTTSLSGITTTQINTNKLLLIKLPYDFDGSPSLDTFKQYISKNPITVQYELATPIVRKIGLTAKGVFTEVSLGDYDWEASPTSSPSTTRYRTTSAKSLPIVYNTHLFTEDFDVRHFNIDSHGDYEYVSNMEYGQYVNVRRERLESDTLEAFKKWLAQNPIKVGYITWKQTSSSYSNIQKPIFFNNVNVQFMNNNVDIQPTLTLQARSMNSYVMNMMKANARYTLKALKNSNSFTIDGTSYSATTNGIFTSPSTLTNKLLITGQDVQELMIIEGDVTGKTIPYYKGIRSSFDDTDEIEVLSKNKNLFDINAPFTKDSPWSTVIEGNSVISTRISDNINGAFGAGFRINNIKPNTVYTLSYSAKQGAIYVYSNSGLWGDGLSLVDYGGGSLSFTTKSDTKYITIGLNYGRYDVGAVLTTTDIKLEEALVASSYQSHKHNTTIIDMPSRWETIKVVKPISEEGALNQPDGSECASTNNNEQRFDYIPVQPNDWILIYNNSDCRAMNCCLYDINKNFIQYAYTNGRGLTVPNDCYFIRGYSSKTNTSNLNIVIQREVPTALNELPNGVKDELIINRATSSAKLIQRVGKVVLDGFSDGHDETVAEFNFRKFVIYTGLTSIKVAGQCVTSNNLPCIVNGEVRNTIRLAVDGKIVINIDGFSSINEYFNYLKQNPITVYYELAEPVITEIRLKGYPFVYEDGSITLNTDIAPVTRTSYNVNQHQLINSQNETIIRHDKQISDLYDYIEIYLDEIYRMELFKMQLELSL